MIEDFKRGIFFSAIGKYSNVVVQLAVTAVLSRILTPKEYGIVAVVNIFLVFFQMLADFGIGPAIIQKKELTPQEVNDIFGFSLYLAVFLGILFMFLGYPISLFYEDSVYIPLSIILGVCIFFYGFLIVPQSLLLRQKNFKTVNIVTILANVISGVISIVLALFGLSYYSIIIGNTAKAFTLFVIFYLQTDLSFKFNISRDPLRKIYDFSKNQFLFNFINYFSRNLDNLLIGRFFSSSALAYYDKAYVLSLYPNQILTSVVTSVIHPIMSEYETQLAKIKEVYFRISSMLATIGMPLSVFLMFSAEEVMLFLFGNQWGGSVVTFQVLAASIWIQMIVSSTGGIFQSGNRTDLLLLSGFLSTVINVSAIVIGIFLGTIESVALMLVCAFSLNFLQVNYLLMRKLFHSKMSDFFKVLVKPFFLAAIQAAFFFLLPDLPFSVFVSLLIKGAGFVVIWLLGTLITGDLALMLQILKKDK